MKELLIPSLIALISGAIGYYLRFRIDNHKELNSKVTEARREHYQEFINIVVDVLKSASQKTEIDSTNVMDKLHEFYKKYLVYASPKVINSFGNYFQFLYHQQEYSDLDIKIKTKEHFKLLAQIVINMRSDLGLSNRNLGKYGEKVFRATISDLDNFFDTAKE